MIVRRHPSNGIMFAALIFVLAGMVVHVCSSSINLNLTKTLSSEDGNIYIYDNTMPKWISSALFGFLSRGAGWKLTWPDPLHPIPNIGTQNVLWVSPISPEYFMKLKPWVVFRMLTRVLTGGLNYVPYEVSGTMLRRGESPTLVQGKNTTEKDLYVRIFLTKKIKGKDMSEMVFYNKKGESVGAIKPKFGRIVVWNDTLSYLYKPPDMNFVDGEYSLLLKMTLNKEKVRKGVEIIEAIDADRQAVQSQPFPFTNVEPFPSELNMGAHCTRKFYDYRGGVIGVFDNLLTMDQLAILRSYLIGYETAYTYNAYSTSETDDADNVSWMMMVKSESIIGSRIWNLVHSIVTHLSGENDWFPYDVSMNIIQNNFHTRIHEDCEDYEHEYTFLMYLNPDWTEDMYGETIFLNQIRQAEYSENGTMLVDKEYEMLVSVRPKYGRAVMFRNNIPHSARPPSPSFTGARYSFAVKVGRNKHIARSKTLRECLEFKSDIQGDPGQVIFQSLSEKMPEGELPISLEEVEKNLAKYRAEKDQASMEDKKLSQNRLLLKRYLSV